METETQEFTRVNILMTILSLPVKSKWKLVPGPQTPCWSMDHRGSTSDQEDAM